MNNDRCGNRRPSRGLAWVFAVLCATVSAAGAQDAAEAQAAAPPAESEGPPPVFLDVSRLEFRYEGNAEGLPSPENLAAAPVRLLPTDRGLEDPREERVAGDPCGRVTSAAPGVVEQPISSFFEGGSVPVEAGAIAAIVQAVVCEMGREGVIGIRVIADDQDVAYRIEQVGGASEARIVGDKREPGDTVLTIVVAVARVTEVRSIASGQRIATEDRMNSDEHRWIREHSPIRPAEAGEDGELSGGVLYRRELDDYLLRLNRHPGRQVDVAIGPALDTGGAVLDYHIAERKPWTAYAQLSNTGTESTDKWRERFGFVHQQLTGRDDILGVEYVTAGFDASHAISASYETPVGPSRALRARLYGSYSEFKASELGQQLDFSGSSWTGGGELALNVYQRGPAFVDLFAGARYFDTSVENQSNANSIVEGEEEFVIVRGGARLERNTRDVNLSAELSLEASLPDVTGVPDTIDDLGRLDADGEWQVVQGMVEVSAYLEPLLQHRTATTLAHELYLSGRVQHSLNDRLIPQVEQIAGGLYTVRGYPEAAVSGDNLYLVTAEYRLHLPRLLPIRANQENRLFGQPFRTHPDRVLSAPDWDVIIRPFTDFARVENVQRKSFESDESLWSAGVGVEFVLLQNVSIRADWGMALSDVESADVNSGDSRFSFVFTLLY